MLLFFYVIEEIIRVHLLTRKIGFDIILLALSICKTKLKESYNESQNMYE